ncbi:hypothetical protein [Sinorhizobium sp. BG8]|uniref:hypothetical protein n=1 Tax=Sinorhizobium sp. BG8 TaxID=2613773 RepID=UPI00193E38DB|nr:hypothetical protein [Sinorhizobium sp. BG8]QRM54959.1 hypothetical protein F3Y30_10680 [Sinorhizobium sp. BG8]
MNHIDEIDAAVTRLIEFRRRIMANVGTDKESLETLAAIQNAFADLVIARDHEEALLTDPLGLDAFIDFRN